MESGNYANFLYKWAKLPEFPDIYLEEICNVLEVGLNKTFELVSVRRVQCPDLTREPFNLAAPGLCGRTALIQVGHRSYLNQNPIPNKIYDIKDIVNCVHHDCNNSFIFGSGFTSFGTQHLKELVTNMLVSTSVNDRIIIRQNSRIITVNRYENKCYLRMLTKSESTCSTCGTFFISQGLVGPVIEVRVRKYRLDVRPSIEGLIRSMLNIVKDKQGESEFVALSGVYVPNIHWKHEVELHFWEPSGLYPVNPNNNIIDAFRFCCVDPHNALITTFTSSTTNKFKCAGFGPIDFENNYVRSLSHHNSRRYITENNYDMEFLGYFYPAEKVYFVDLPLY